MNPTGFRHCHDEGKRCAGALFFSYRRQNNLPIKFGRIFNTCGTRIQFIDGRVFSNFIIQALQGKPITLYGDGSQTRSFCHADDLIDCMTRFMDYDADFTGPMNMGNPGEFTIRGFAGLVMELSGSKSEIIYEPLPQDDPQQRRSDISLAKGTLAGNPKSRSWMA